jgi:drug/metabolite transporter (DMT)-like permease
MKKPGVFEALPTRKARSDKPDYGLGILYAIATAALLALQEPFSALAARTLSSLDFMALTQFALLLSLPFLLWRAASRRDFAAILLDIRQWPKLAVIFLVGLAGLSLYDIGLSSSHPIITAAVLNLSPFWAALVAFGVSRRSIAISPWAFWLSFVVAFCGAMAIAWSQFKVDNHALAQDVIDSLLHSKWIYALPMPAFFALSGTLVYEWFRDYDEAAAIGANFAVSALVLLPVAAINSSLRQSAAHLSEQTSMAIVLLLAGTLAASAAGRLFYQLALTETRNDNGTVTMFFLLIPAISTVISWPLSRWIPTLSFIPGPAFVVGMSLVSVPLIVVWYVSRRGWSAARATSSRDAVNPAE